MPSSRENSSRGKESSSSRSRGSGGGSSRSRSDRESRASRVFRKLDADGNKSLEQTEMQEFINSQDKLWERLSKSVNQSKKEASNAATLVAMELATGLQGDLALGFAVTKEQFKQFHDQHVKDKDGFEEFFQRTVFAMFDEDGNGELDSDELDLFLEAIYSTRDVRKGRVSLYSKDEMKALILEKHDKDGGGTLDFKEVQNILGGGAKALGALKKEFKEEGGESIEEITKKYFPGGNLDADAFKRRQEEAEQAASTPEKKTAAPTMASAAPAASAQKKKESFSFFQYIVDLFMPPKSQTTGAGGGQLVVKESSCVIL